jgi:Tfp pilus assembly protein PilN
MSFNDNDMSFLPDGYLEDKSQRRANILWGGVFIIVAVAIGFAYYYAEKNVRAEEDLNKAVQAKYEASKKNLEKLTNLNKLQQDLNRKVKLSGSLVEKVLRTEVLAELTNLLPPNVTLLSVQLENKKVAAAPTPRTRIEEALLAHEQAKNPLPEPIQYDVPITVTGLAKDDLLVAQYMSRLAQSPLFQNTRLGATAEFTPEGGKDKEKAAAVRKFDLDLMLRKSADTRLAPATRPATAN